MEKRAATIFNGTYTLTWPNGQHRTFEIKTQPDDSHFAPGKRIIRMLVGPDNTRDYQGFGFVTNDGINLWSKYRGGKHEGYIVALWSLATESESSRFFLKGYRLLQSNTCVKCNHKLTDPLSITLGIGPECGGRRGKKKDFIFGEVL